MASHPPPYDGEKHPLHEAQDDFSHIPDTQASSSYSAKKEQEDRDYALALQLQDEDDEPGPPLPPRRTQAQPPQQDFYPADVKHPDGERGFAPPQPQPPVYGQDSKAAESGYAPQPYQEPLPQYQYSQPPDIGQGNITPIHYTRDPRRLVAYLVPFPKPDVHKHDAPDIPDRFFIYTPPPPPLRAPKEGEKEDRTHKIQRKWQEAVREAKTVDSKLPLNTWKGIKGRTTKGVDMAIGWTTTSNLDFLNRVPVGSSKKPIKPTEPVPANGGHAPVVDEKLPNQHENPLTAHPTQPGQPPQEHQAAPPTTAPSETSLQELLLLYPTSMPGTESQIRTEFVNSMLRTKTKAQRDAVIGTGLLPFTFVFDVFVPLSGFFEVNAVWAYSSVKGSQSARSVTARLQQDPAASDEMSGAIPSQKGKGKAKEKELKLTLTPSPKLDVLQRYLAAQLNERDKGMFPIREGQVVPKEEDVLEALGWTPAELEGGEEKSREDVLWEIEEAKDDLRVTMRKGAKEWQGWCKDYLKNPEKALKK